LGSSSGLKLTDGEIYKAQVTEKSDSKIKLMLNGTALDAGIPEGLNVNVGDELNLKAAKKADGGFELKILGAIEANTPGKAELDSSQTRELFKQSGFISDENIFEIKSAWETNENTENIELAISRVKAKISQAGNNLTLSAINDLLASGVSIQNLNLDMLNAVLAEVSTSPEVLTEEQLDGIIDGYMQKYSPSPEAAQNSGEIIKFLTDNNLPVTQDNVEFMEKFLKLYESIDLKEGSMAYLISQDKELTLLDLYKANRLSLDKKENPDMELLEKEIGKLFEQEGIEDNEDNRKMSKFLYEYDLPITKKNVDKFRFIYKIQQNGTNGNIPDCAINAIKNGVKVPDAVIYDDAERADLENTYSNLLEKVPMLSDRHIAYASYRVTTAVTLSTMLSHNVPEDFTYSNVSQTSKLYLAEIQLRLTHISAAMLISKGININTMPLAKAVYALRQADNDVYAEALTDSGIQQSAANMSKMDEIYTAARSFSQVNVSFYQKVVSRGSDGSFTVSEVHASKTVTRVMESYSGQSDPNGSFNDSFEDGNQAFRDLLSNMGLSDEMENVRAARILSQADLEVNYTAITQVRMIDMKLNKVQNGLHPHLAADMIKNGFDFLNANIDDVNRYIDEYNNENGNNVKDNIAEYIYEMDKDGELNKTTRESVIALYRLFNTVNKNSAAIALNIAARHSATLKNLLDAAGFLKSNVDYEIGEDSEITSAESSIRALLTQKERRIESEYNALSVKNIESALNMNNIAEIVENKKLWNLPVNEIIEYLKNYKTSDNVNSEKAQSALNDINNMLNYDPRVFVFLESVGLSATLGNIKAYHELIKPGSISKMLDDINEDSDEKIEAENADDIDPENVLKSMSYMGDKAEENTLESGKINLLKEVRLLQNAVKVQSAISRRSNSYRIPVNISGENAQLNLYMPYGFIPANKSLDVAISIETKSFSFRAMCSVSESKNIIRVESEQSIGNDKLLDKINSALTQYGFTNNEVHVNEGLDMPVQEDSERLMGSWNKADKDTLFNLAKAVMKAVHE
jgi:hypothetical protein